MRLHVLALAGALAGCASRPVAYSARSLPQCTGSSSIVSAGRWTARVYMYATTEKPCPEFHRLGVVVLMRGEAGWYDRRRWLRERMIADGVIDTLKLYALQNRIMQRHPSSSGSTLYLGDLVIDVHSTEQPQPMVWVTGRQIMLDSNNVVLVDRYDGVGGPPRIELLRLENPVFDAFPTMESLEARSPRIRRFIEE